MDILDTEVMGGTFVIDSVETKIKNCKFFQTKIVARVPLRITGNFILTSTPLKHKPLLHLQQAAIIYKSVLTECELPEAEFLENTITQTQ